MADPLPDESMPRPVDPGVPVAGEGSAPGKAPAPLFGLVLGGGRSARMGADKAALDYHGVPQTTHCFNQLQARCAKVFLSNRKEQADAPGFAGTPQIHDSFFDMGPMGGILSALKAHPEAAWLVLACDLPFLDAHTLDALVRGRDPSRMATAFSSLEDGLPEPLCAIYEPVSFSRLLELQGRGIRCPRKALIQSDFRRLELEGTSESNALRNVNRPEEFRAALDSLKPPKGHR